MKAIIPVAGKGTRLYPHTLTTPKVLLRVGSKSIIVQIIDRLIKIGVTELVPVLGVMGDVVISFLKDYYSGIPILPVFQEERKGLGHAVMLSRETVGNKPSVIVYGDTIVTGSLEGFVNSECDGVIGVKKVEDPRRFGIVFVKDGKITRVIEKPQNPESNLAIVGMNYIRNTSMLFDCLDEMFEKNIRTRGEFQLSDAFQLMVDHGADLRPYTIENWLDCGTPETYLQTSRIMLDEEGLSPQREGSTIIPPVFIDDSAQVERSVIGPHVSIGPETVIKTCVIEDSIILDGAHLENCVLNKSIIGNSEKIIEPSKSLNIGNQNELPEKE